VNLLSQGVNDANSYVTKSMFSNTILCFWISCTDNVGLSQNLPKVGGLALQVPPEVGDAIDLFPPSPSFPSHRLCPVGPERRPFAQAYADGGEYAGLPLLCFRVGFCNDMSSVTQSRVFQGRTPRAHSIKCDNGLTALCNTGATLVGPPCGSVNRNAVRMPSSLMIRVE
jgi:hypothetical protein